MARESETSDDHLPDAGEVCVRVAALEHPMVLAAMARLASSGVWQHVIDERPLLDPLDIADAELLVAAGALRRVGDSRFRLALSEPMYRDPQTVADSAQFVLRRAIAHASGRVQGWSSEDPETVQAFGRLTRSGGDVIADDVLPRLPAIEAAFRAGTAAFLDVGVGIAAISIRLIERYPNSRAVGLDVLADVLEVARVEVTRNGLADSIELRLQSVADLRDQDRYDLAWVPQNFIPREAFVAGVQAVFNALKPGGALLVPVTLHAQASEFVRARAVHSVHLAGGSTLSPGELVELLDASGFTDLTEHPVPAQMLMTAIKPRGS